MINTSPLKLALITTCMLLLPVTGNIAAAASDMTVPGQFSHRATDEDMEFLGDIVCFYPTDKNFGPILKLRHERDKNDNRLAWFCFKNTQKAKADFGIPSAKPKNACGYEGKATVLISDYQLAAPDTGSSDTATLKKIISKGPLSKIPCPQ